MTVKISGQNYVTYSFIIPCLKSLQVGMEALCENDDDNSEFKIQIASALKRSVNFYIDELDGFWIGHHHFHIKPPLQLVIILNMV